MNKKNVILCVNSHAASPFFSHIQIFTKINFVCKSGTRKWNNSARFYFMQKNPADEIAWAKCKFKKITHGLVAYFFFNNSTHVFFLFSYAKFEKAFNFLLRYYKFWYSFIKYHQSFDIILSCLRMKRYSHMRVLKCRILFPATYCDVSW